ncbi:hypothetical protein HZH66_001402 [Vespula vulgaris]|uniref:Uncharacterized protein n=1 Tax=Vespula vulgaris TaxID=7454 RepID=A0A834KT10_VESVU|nr:hypothetical protein HZH66_001402 [Vespula vulgaris]
MAFRWAFRWAFPSRARAYASGYGSTTQPSRESRHVESSLGDMTAAAFHESEGLFDRWSTPKSRLNWPDEDEDEDENENENEEEDEVEDENDDDDDDDDACGPNERTHENCLGKKKKTESRRFRGSLFIDVRIRLSECVIYEFRGRTNY